MDHLIPSSSIMGYIGYGLGLYWGFIGYILGLYWGYIGIVENRMETTIYWGYIGITEKENGSYYLGLAFPNWCVLVPTFHEA